jgi:plasmid stabilization system protein ParE
MKMPERFMKNTYRLIWSDEALENLKKIIEYLENRWTKKEIQKFAKLLDKRLDLIEKNPFLFAESKNFNDLRRSVLSKQTTIYYRINNNDVHIITLFDNRQNPENIRNK